MIWTLAIDDFSIGQKAFAADAVQSFILVEVDVPLIVDLLQYGGHHGDMARLGRTQEIIIADAQFLPRLNEGCGDTVGVGLRLETHCGSGGEDLLAMLIGARQQVGVVAVEPVVAGQHVGDNGRVGMPHVRLAIDVVEGRCEVGDTTHRWLLSFYASRTMLSCEGVVTVGPLSAST